MKFSELSIYLEKLDKTPSRLAITEILADLFKKSEVNEIDKLVYLILGGLAPKYESIVFNIADQVMLQIISEAYGAKLDKVKSSYQKKGDLGDVASAYAGSQNSNTKSQMSVLDVYKELKKVAEDGGGGTVERKVKGLAKLISGLDPLSVKYVARIPIGKLRLGFSDKTILDALSWMISGDKSNTKKLEKAYFVRPDVGLLAKNVKQKGLEKATNDPVPMVGVPILPMLCSRIKSPTEMIEKMGEVAVESKLDGLRISIHFKAGKNGFTKTFTRNMNETSWMFPELANSGKYINATEIIIDSEAMGMSEDRKKLANFQATMTRRRKHDVGDTATAVPIKFYVFDIMLKDGKNLISLDYLERRKILESTIKTGKLFKVVDYELTKDPEKIKKEHAKKIKEGLEGIIIKRLDSGYVPGRTGWRWVKMKEAEEAKAKLADTVDCVVMGYSVGKGKRAGFGVGRFLVGVLDGEKIKTVTKIGTGITDAQFGELKTRLTKLEVSKKPNEYIVNKILEPDYWTQPSLVVEVAADEITKSPSHTAGYALRFPRLVKFRDDKSVVQATNIKELIKLFELQEIN